MHGPHINEEGLGGFGVYLWVGLVKLICAECADIRLDASCAQGHDVKGAEEQC